MIEHVIICVIIDCYFSDRTTTKKKEIRYFFIRYLIEDEK
jgi:hypothetical protein